MKQRVSKRLNQGEGGFTLIELLIVIVILGILAAIVVFAVGTARDDSVNSACEADKKTVSVALEAYKAKEGEYPGAQDADDNDLVGDYIKTWPTSDEYTIAVTADGDVLPDACPAAG